jgi:hypothetical protein
MLCSMRLSTAWFGSAKPRPSRFNVDDVAPSTEVLPTSELLSVMNKKLGRTVVTSPLQGIRVVDCNACSRHPLVAAVHLAFSRHLPLTLSPDAIWLTIVQGFSHHINEHAEALRGRLVRHQGRRDLVEQIGKLSAKELAAAVSGFSRQIRDATDPALYDALICNFTTTTAEVRTASEIAFMDTYSQYFRFTISMCVCGIPNITLTGCIDDWQRMRDRIEMFESFGLDWWVSRLRPILDEFVRAADGQPDREFWQGIYKFRPPKGPYDAEMVTGWLVDLFPYLGDAPSRRWSHVFERGGNREVAAGAFPSGLCKVEVHIKLMDDNGHEVATKDLDLVAGLLGVKQSDNRVWPIISWCLADRVVLEEDKPTSDVLSQLKQQVTARHEST